MRNIFLEKVTVNVCVGNDKQGMVKAEKLLKKLSLKGRKKLNIVPIYGGQSIDLQLRSLKKGIDIVGEFNLDLIYAVSAW